MKNLLLLILVSMVLMTGTVSAQTTDEEIIDKARTEVIQVVSDATLDVWALVVGSLVIVVAIVTTTAITLVYRSTPQWAHSGMISVADKAIETLQVLASKTTIGLDDKIADAIRGAFEKFTENLTSPPPDSDDDKNTIKPTQ